METSSKKPHDTSVDRRGFLKGEGATLGRPRTAISADDLQRTAHLSIRNAAHVLGVPTSVFYRARTAHTARP